MSGRTASLRAAAVLRRIQHVRNPVGVEVGVFNGAMSRALLGGRAGLFLYMVDSWLGQEEQPASYRDYGDYHSKLSMGTQQQHRLNAVRGTALYKGRRSVMAVPSEVAAREFGDNSLDFVFLDADHSVEGVTADIAAWWPKVKPNGYLCGHDYGGWLCVGKERQYFGVKQAVDTFAARCGVEVVDDVDYTFFIERPQ